MMTLFRGIGTLLTLEGADLKGGRKPLEQDLGIEKNWAFAIQDGRIAWMGPEKKIPKKSKFKKELSLSGQTVAPSFLECHTHLVFAGSRTAEFEMRQKGMTYQQIAEAGGGIRSTMIETRRAPETLLIELAQERVDRFAAQGVSTVEVKTGYGLSLKDEIKCLRVIHKLKGPRIVPTYLGPHTIPPESDSAEEYLTEVMKKHLPDVRKQGLASRADIFIEKGYFSVDQGRRYGRFLKDWGWDLTIHADQLTESGGTELGIELEAKSVDHVLKISDQTLQRLAQSNTTAVLLPAADLYLGVEYPRARQMIDRGARVALATDFNPGSSPTQDLSLVGLLARLEMKMSLAEVISAYTVGAAHALGMEKDCGALRVGKFADFSVLEGDFNDLFYQVGSSPVVENWSRGRRIYKKS